MSIYSVILLFFFIFGLYFSYKVRNRDPRNTLYRLTSSAIFSCSALAFWEYEMTRIREIESMLTAGIIHSCILALTVYLSALSTWYFMYVSNSKQFPRRNFIFHSVYSISFFVYFFGQLYGLTGNGQIISQGFTFENGLWQYQINTTLGWLLISCIVFYILSLITINFSVWIFYWRNNTPNKSKLAKVTMPLISIITFSMFFIFLFNGELQQNGYYLMSPGVMIGCIGLSWSFSNYKLFELSPVSAMDNIMDSMSNLIAISDNDFNIKYLNRIAREEMKIGAKNVSDLSFKNITETYNYDNWPEILTRIKKLKFNEKFQNEFQINIEDSLLSYHITVTPIFNDQKEKKGYVALASNITAIKQAEVKLKKHAKKLEESNLELERFAYIASHDLKTPLRNVASFLSLIERKIKKYEDRELVEFIQIAKNSSSQMYHLIQDVLEYSQVNNYQHKTLETVDLNEVIYKTNQTLQVIIKEKKGNIFCDQLPRVMGDKVRLAQLFQNLIENGLKYNENESPTVHISYQKTTDFHIFYIKDNGIGINKEYQERVFEMFKRLHTYNEYEGSGIGLAVCKKIVSSYNGNIMITSKEGHGSTFKISLQFEDPKPVPQAQPVAQSTNHD